MTFKELLGVEFKKLKHSKLLLILFAAAVILWIPSIINADLNFQMQAEGISPENNFFIQGFLAMSWFLFPASMVVGTVLINQTERQNRGIVKMLSLPINTVNMCLAKFVVLIIMAALQILMTTVLYYISAAIASGMQSYNLILNPLYVFREVCFIYLSAIPMLSFFWALSICVKTPIFSVGIGLASIVPSVLIMNTKAWIGYPMCYSFYLITSEYGRLAGGMSTWTFKVFPWLIIAILFTVFCLVVSCFIFGRSERR